MTHNKCIFRARRAKIAEMEEAIRDHIQSQFEGVPIGDTYIKVIKASVARKLSQFSTYLPSAHIIDWLHLERGNRTGEIVSNLSFVIRKIVLME
jgi:hypothetical protein